MSAETKELLVRISATTELLRQQMIAAENSVERGVRGIQRDLDKLDNKFGKVGKGVGLINGALASFSGNVASTALSAIASSLEEMVRTSFELGTSLSEASSKLGVSVEDLQRYRYIADQVGISQETMDAGLMRLTKSAGQADAGNKKLKKAFDELGVSIRDSNGKLKTAGQLFPELVAAISAIPDPAKRAAFEVAIFNKSGQELENLLGGGTAALNKMSAEFDRLGIALNKEQAERLDAAADAVAKFKAIATGKFTIWLAEVGLPELTAEIERTKKEVESLIGLWNKFRNLDWITPEAQEFFGMRERLGLPAAANENGGAKPKAAPTATPRAITPSNRFVPTPGRGPLKGGLGGAFGLGGLALQIDISDLLERAGASAVKVTPDIRRVTQELKDLNVELLAAGREQQPSVNFIGDSGSDQIADMVAAADERLAVQQDINQQIADDYRDKLNNATAFAADTFETLLNGGIDDVWDNFERIGLRVIAQVAAQMAISLFSGNGTGNIGGFFASALGSILGFADGGNPPVGKASMVGERGPELFVPRVPGTIISNDNLGGIGGGRGGDTYVINAPGATAETVQMIRRELRNFAPTLVQTSKQETYRDARRVRI